MLATLVGGGPNDSSGTSSPGAPPSSSPDVGKATDNDQPSLLKLPYTSWSEGRHEALERRIAAYLQDFEGVEAADVLISQPVETPFAAEEKPVTAVVRLRLAPGARLSAEQLLALARSLATRVPDLDPIHVTITDAAARVVLQDGVARPEGAAGPPVAVVSAPLQAGPTGGFSLPQVVLAGGIGLSVGLLLATVAWSLRRGPAASPPAGGAAEEPFAFLAELSAGEIVKLLADERPALVAAALPALHPRTQRRVLRALGAEQREAAARAVASRAASAAARGTRRPQESLRAASAALQAKLGRRRRQAHGLRALLAAAPASEREALSAAAGLAGGEEVSPWRE